ncbi:TonB-dependent siderophore receptor [Kingella potus]|uniref:TonB-dependent siderophore receptor n=1 Tax=Kingella potus TaxID=265175 RepID=UPI001FD2D91D|nr:TonB-dependent siderophore receptor [Kingella potus]UOP00782.1 TonB-dependent siderophore receptor [Kingella potus]
MERNRSFKDDVHGHGGLIYGVMDADAGENTKITFGGMYQDKTEMPDYFGIPMGLNGAEAGLPRDTYLGFNWNEARFKKFNAFAEVEHHFNDDWKLTGRLNYIKNKSDSRFGAITNLSTSYQGLSPGGTLAVNNLQNYKNKGYQFSGGLNLNGKYQLFGQSHDLFAGYTYSNENTDTLWRRIRNSTRYDPFTFQGNEVPSPNWDTDFNDRLSYDSKIVSHGLMFGTRFNPTDRLHIIAGTRWTHWKSSSGTYYDIWNNRPDTDTDKKDEAKRSRFVPYLGITFDITKQQSVYASYTSIFKPQSSTDYNYKILPPMLGNNYEIGWKGEWMNRKLNTSVALFQVEQKNRAVAFTELSTNRVYFEPSGKVVSRGIDAEISGKLNDNWQLFAGYTLNNSKYQETENSSRTRGLNFSKHTPRHMLRLYTSYKLPVGNGKWTVGGGASIQSKTSSLADVKQGGYMLMNANVQYRPSENLSLALIGSNLTNRRYYENQRTRVNGGNNFYGEPRNLMFKVDYKF